MLTVKVNSIQEACPKYLPVHNIKFEIFQATWKNKTKSNEMLELLMKNWKIRVWCSLLHFIHVICKISNFNMWTAKHLAQGSCTELTLLKIVRAVSRVVPRGRPPTNNKKALLLGIRDGMPLPPSMIFDGSSQYRTTSWLYLASDAYLTIKKKEICSFGVKLSEI